MATTLELELPDPTLRKLRALAMLKGMTVVQLQERLVEHFDQLLTEECAEALGIAASTTQVIHNFPSVQTGVVTSGYIAPAADAPFVPEVIDEHNTEHDLSGDADDGVDVSPRVEDVEGAGVPVGIKAPEPQEEEDDTGIPNRPFEIKAKIAEAGDSADAYLEAAMESEKDAAKKKPTGNSPFYFAGERASKAVGSFQQVRARVSEYTGDEG